MAKTEFDMKPLSPRDRTKRYYARILGPGKIMVVREKHSTRYFKTDTLQEFCAASLFLLIERWGPDGYWGTADEQVAAYESLVAERTPPECTVEELIEKTGISPESGIVLDLKGRWKSHRKYIEEYGQEADMYRRIKKAIKERDGLAAAQLMHDRNGYEYECWDFEKIEAPLENT